MVLVTADKDMLQLVGPAVRVLSTNVRGEPIWFDDDAVTAKWGVAPKQIPDLLALMGDSIDNIPACPGRREDGGQAQSPNSAASSGSTKISPSWQGKLRETLATHREQAFLSRELAMVSTRVPIAQDLEAFKRQEPDWERLRALWTELEFETLLRQLPAAETPVAVTESLPSLEGPRRYSKWLAEVPPAIPWRWIGWRGRAAGAGPHRARRLSSCRGSRHPETGAGAPDFGAGRSWAMTSSPSSSGGWPVARPPLRRHPPSARTFSIPRAPATSSTRSARSSREGPGLATAGSRARWCGRSGRCSRGALKEVSLHTLYGDLEQPLVPVLAAMERHGIRVDPARLEELLQGARPDPGAAHP